MMHPQVLANAMRVTASDSDRARAAIWSERRSSWPRAAASPLWPAPRLGTDATAVLADRLGLSGAEIELLRANRAFGGRVVPSRGCNPTVVRQVLVRQRSNDHGRYQDAKTQAAAHHNNAARHLEITAGMHRDAAKHCRSGNFEQAQHLATEAAQTDTAANQHAMQAVDLYRHHGEQVAARKAEVAAEEAARAVKKAAKT
jgi:hypothetical protein